MAYYDVMDKRAVDNLMRLEVRRRNLGMSLIALARRSGVPLRTVQRILSGRDPNASFAHVMKLAEALGTSVSFDPNSGIEDILKQQALRQAERLVGLVQGTSRLEAQGLNPEQLRRMVRRTSRELLAGSKRRLWSA